MLAEPSATVGRQGRRMHRFQHEVARLVNHISLSPCKASPQHIDDMVTLRGKRMNGCIGECLPSQRGMAVGKMCPHRECGIEQQHPLLRPSGKVSRLGNRTAQGIVYLLEDVLQRRRERHPVLHREAQSMRLSRLMIRVLADDYHLHLLKRT